MTPYCRGTVRVTSPYGMRTLAGKTEMHKGIDLVGTDKTITAVEGGTVLFSRKMERSGGNRTWEWGNYICIRTEDGILHYYCHLEKRDVKAGETVHKGQIIGREGSTGYSTGSHLHFEVRDKNGTSVDPTPILGIGNRIGQTDAGRAWHSDMVCSRCGFEEKTRSYLDRYAFAPDLWRKLWESMDRCGS
ncbi:MAG: M23 family metallopeptidase [Clostridia bacterium]|nr:M23 family metallopeptidase [Clostridia bacterium]